MSRDALHKLRWCELASKVFGHFVIVSTKIYSCTHKKYTHILNQNILIKQPKLTYILNQGTNFWGAVDASGQPQPRPQVVNITS